jgi:hypothetical protein
MADNMPVTPGSGATVAADDIGGVLYQRVKIGVGADGSATDVSSAAPMPVNVISAIPAGTNNIGDVDVLTLPAIPTGSNTIGAVNLAQYTPATGRLPVDGSGVTQPVSDAGGSITVDAPVGTPAFVRLSDGSAAITTLPVSLASVPSHAVTNAGTFATQDSQTVTDNAGFTDGTTKVFVHGFIYDEVAGTALTENDAAAARINVNRAQIGIIEDGVTRGRYATVTAASALKVDGSAVTQPVGDAGGSLTVDAPVATPVFVRLSDGTSAISTLPVSYATTGSGTATGAMRVELPTNGTGVVGLNTGTNVVGRVGIDQTTPGTTDSVSVKTAGYVSQPTVTRPANTTAYAAGDVVGGAITFTSAGPSGGHLLITDADLRIDVSAVPSGMTTFRLHLYDVTPPSAIADNAAWDLPSGDRASYLGYVDLTAPTDQGSTLYTQATAVNRKVKLASASTSLFGYLVTTAGYTPAANSEVYAPRIGGTAL